MARKYDRAEIKINGYRGEVKNTFYRQHEETGKIAIMFPGMGYTCQMPLIYYPTMLLLDLGFDVLWVETDYGDNEEFMSLGDDEKEEWMRGDASAALDAAFERRNHKRLILLGKSLGTGSLAVLSASDSLLADTRFCWLTPLLKDNDVFNAINSVKGRSLLVIGTADPRYDKALLEKIKDGGRVAVLEAGGADHSLEIAGNVPASLFAMRKILKAIKELAR